LDRKLHLLARGYERVVYGDHGPYVELTAAQINWTSFPKFRKKHALAYYDEYFTEDMSIMICAQRRPVWDRPNPPKYGKHSVNNNRPEGYADYRPDRYYMAPDPTHLLVHRPAHLPRPSEQLLVPSTINADGALHAAWQRRFNALQVDRDALTADKERAEQKVRMLEDSVKAMETQVARLAEENERLRSMQDLAEGGTGMGVLTLDGPRRPPSRQPPVGTPPVHSVGPAQTPVLDYGTR